MRSLGKARCRFWSTASAVWRTAWSIAEYLEDTYPQRPSLFGSAEGRALARFLNQWVNTVLHPAIARVILPDVLAILHEEDRAYFRSTREAALGISIESLRAARDESFAALHRVLKPLRDTLSAQPFLAGKGPLFPDHIAFGAFQWGRVVSQVELFSQDDPVAPWCARMLDAYDGLARSAPRAA